MSEKKSSFSALLPIGVFLLLFIGAGILYKDFYKMPAIVAFLIALAVAFAQNRSLKFDDKIRVIAEGLADDNVITMCLIFLAAGGFSGAVSAAGGVDSTVNLALIILPSSFAVVGLFIISCFISTAMGTSVGTIVAIAPIAAGISEKTGYGMALCVSAVVCGAMFGDNLSMISDTTIAAVRTQGCKMKDKFKMNFFIVLPAAIITAVIYYLMTMHSVYTPDPDMTYNLWQVLPYLFVLIGALCGMNIFLVLIIGTAASVIIGIGTGTIIPSEVFNAIGDGVTSMYDITVISIVVCCIGSLIKEAGGIQAVLDFVRSRAKTKKGAQIGIAALVAGVDVATANNTIAIVMTGPIAKEISEEFDIDPRRTASLLDIFASVIQGILPYGAQLLYASAQTKISSLAIVPYLYYPLLMAVSALVFILFLPEKQKKSA